MNGLRFKVGELAIYAVARETKYQRLIGKQCVIDEVGPFPPFHVFRDGKINRFPGDYCVIFLDGFSGAPMDWQLRKMDPPAEPQSMTRTEECEVEA